MQCNAMVIGRS